MLRIDDYEYAKEIFAFVEEACQKYTSCLIASATNKCNTVVCALIYLMMKFKWNLHRSLEYICGRKNDVEITKAILKQLHKLEQSIQKD